MAVELLLLNFDGPAGRKKGAIINIQEAADDQPIKWGKAEKPPHFRIMRIEGVIKADLDPDWLEFGGHMSKALVDDTKLSKNEKDDLDDVGAYRDGNAEPKKNKAKIAHARLAVLKKDNSADWNARETAMEEAAAAHA